ncbi:unnamed protein product [Symbiodinium pilosum]|uniref:Uncharacterized protein n=1 Tax=Symbiodinium pilosum TaxID=2952 RepID=A0A812P3V9_SYMPI|nr:unnamed protein product [Symbiodinium pilosum]
MDSFSDASPHSLKPCNISRGRWVPHAWASLPVSDAEVWKVPEKGAIVRWGQSLEVLAVQLKVLASALLRLLEHPDHHAAAVQATLRSALHHCASVSHREVLPGVRLFMMKSGIRFQDWRQAVAREKRLKSGTSPPPAAQEEVDLLSSDRQRALVRSLQVASSVGVPEAAQLASRIAAYLCVSERLHHQAQLSAKGCEHSGIFDIKPQLNAFNESQDFEAPHRVWQPVAQGFEHHARKVPRSFCARPKSCPRR